jgi:hypothetical protein
MRPLSILTISSIFLVFFVGLFACDENEEIYVSDNEQLKQDLQGNWIYKESYGGIINTPFLDSGYFESNTTFKEDSLIWYDSTYSFNTSWGQTAQVISGSYFVYYTYSGNLPYGDISRYNRGEKEDVLFINKNTGDASGICKIKDYREVNGELVLEEVWSADGGFPYVTNGFVTFNRTKDTVIFEIFTFDANLGETRFARK